jgi:hypothetical protein
MFAKPLANDLANAISYDDPKACLRLMPNLMHVVGH